MALPLQQKTQPQKPTESAMKESPGHKEHTESTYGLKRPEKWSFVAPYAKLNNKEYLAAEGIDMKVAEPTPVATAAEQQDFIEPSEERSCTQLKKITPSQKFYMCPGKVLNFYGIWKKDTILPATAGKITLHFYLEDDTLEVLEDRLANNMQLGRGDVGAISCISGFGLGGRTIIRRQKVLLNEKRDAERIPCDLESRGEENRTWMTAEHLRTGRDVRIFGKTFFLAKCDDFTKQFYKYHLGIEMPQVELTEKSNYAKITLSPPERNGPFEAGTTNGCHPGSQPVQQESSKTPMRPEVVPDTVLKFSAKMDSVWGSESSRQFVLFFYVDNNTVKLHEERVNGYTGGTFLRRSRLLKELGRTANPNATKGAKPMYYTAGDFYIGAKIKAKGRTFLIKDADLSVFKFIGLHPEIYGGICARDQKELADIWRDKIQIYGYEKLLLLEELKDNVRRFYGIPVFPIPETLDLGTGLKPRKIVEQKLYSANLPISQTSTDKLLDAFTYDGKTVVDEVKAFLLAACGHKEGL